MNILIRAALSLLEGGAYYSVDPKSAVLIRGRRLLSEAPGLLDEIRYYLNGISFFTYY